MSLEKFYLKIVFIKNYLHRELHIFLYLVFLLFYLLYFQILVVLFILQVLHVLTHFLVNTKNQVIDMKTWYELWSKAGAS